ncbi:MAG: glycosyltransferase [Verrucomicrobia bacterium]|nr:glycosyltransferase [Verrucomicrobiota bacterium]
MKIVIFGLTVSSSWGNGHATLWRGLIKALIRRGHEIVFFEKDVPYYAGHRDLWGIPGGELVIYSDWNDVRPLARKALSDADVGMVTSYCADALVATEIVLSSPAKIKAFYDLDTPVTLENLRTRREVAYIGERGLSDFDLVLSYTGGAALDELQRRLGARRVAPLYGSVDPEVHCPVPSRNEYRCDISYLGTYAEDRQAALETLFIEAAKLLPGKRFLIGGAQYPAAFPWTENIFFARHVSPPEHPAFYSSSRITLNVTRRAMAHMGYCPSGRMFEAAACGIPILTDWWQGLDQFFNPASEVMIARTTEDSVAALQLSDAELEQLSQAARERVLSEHTAERRAIDLEEALDGVLRPAPEINGAAAKDLDDSAANKVGRRILPVPGEGEKRRRGEKGTGSAPEIFSGKEDLKTL